MDTSILKIIPSTEGKTKKATVVIEGGLTIENTEKIKNEAISAIDKYSSIEFKIINVTDIDLSFLQLFYAIQVKCKKLDKKLIIRPEFQPELKRLIDNSGFTALFS
jgi:anti-anti-sigma regulatory factor